MTKLMYAFRAAEDHRDALHHHLLAAPLREDLAGLGATRLQVNLDDDEVAAAMRIPTTQPPVSAIASVWLGTDDAQQVDHVTAALTALAAPGHPLSGWQVEERSPIPPPETPDGVRVDTLANFALLRRPDELTHEEWLHRWLVDHTPVAIATQATFGYVQNVVVAPVISDGFHVDALVEELFVSAAMTDMHAFYGSDGDDEELGRRLTDMMASVSRFGADRGLDLVPTSRYTFRL